MDFMEKIRTNNQNDKVTWDKSHHSMFENFALDLNGFTNTGQYPADAGQDVKYGLELQFERLKEKNLKMKYGIAPRGLLADGQGFGKQWSDDRYISRMEYRSCSLSRTLYRDSKKLYQKNQNSIFYQIITDVHNSHAVAEELYSCPNCGAVSKIKVLQNGCPFCGTFFEMNDLFPKVTNYFFIKDSGYTQKEIKRSIGKVILPCMVLSMIAYTIFFLKTNLDPNVEEAVAQIVSSIVSGMIGGAVFGAISGYVLWAVLKIGSLFVQAGKSIPMLVNSAGSGKRFVSFMSQYSPEFSYEYFSGKVVSLIKMIIFCKNENNLPYYEGASLGNRFLNVVESSYTGAVALKTYGVQGDYCYVSVDVYLENLYDNGNRIETKNEIIHVELRRNIRKPINVHFSIESIQCKSCGASFNAAKMRNCPHCGTRYEIGDDDWIITKLY